MKKEKKTNIIQYKRNASTFFKIGMKYVGKQKYITALDYIAKAVELEPYNADYQFNMACVLSELKETRKANEILLEILKNMDPTLRECYFGIGCNYFEMSNFKKAREYFEKYIYYDPDGQFVNEAYDILYYLQIYDDIGLGAKKSGAASRMVKSAAELVEKGEYQKALQKLQKTLEMDAELIEPRNEISRVYFLNGDTDKALSLARSVLKLNPHDMTANCNIAEYYKYMGETVLLKKQLQFLTGLRAGSYDELLKQVYTYIDLKEYPIIKKALGNYSGDSQDIEDVIEDVLNNRNLDKSTRDAVLDELYRSGENPKGASRFKLPEAALNNFIKASVKWRKEWEDIIDCAFQNKETIYTKSYKSELKSIWLNFVIKAYPEGNPQISKREIWAATLEYLYCNMHLIRVSKQKLAEKYKISVASITNKLKEFKSNS